MTLWGGRFTQKMDPAAWDLNLSLRVDRRLASQDVEGSLVWAAALHQAGALPDDEFQQISAGLKIIQDEFSGQTFSYQPGDEDIHSAVERRLTELVGPVAGKLHTGRSRNDQVATDFRLWVLQTIPTIDNSDRGFASGVGRSCRNRSRDVDARLYPPATRSAGPISPLVVGAFLAAAARPRTPGAVSRANRGLTARFRSASRHSRRC